MIYPFHSPLSAKLEGTRFPTRSPQMFACLGQAAEPVQQPSNRPVDGIFGPLRVRGRVRGSVNRDDIVFKMLRVCCYAHHPPVVMYSLFDLHPHTSLPMLHAWRTHVEVREVPSHDKFVW